MIDIKIARTNPDVIRIALQNRNQSTEALDRIIAIDEIWRRVKKEEDELRAERNKLGLEIADGKKKGVKVDSQLARSTEVSARIKQIAEEQKKLDADIELLALSIPNVPHATVPVGKDEKDNPEVRKWGAPKKTSKDVLSHDVFGEKTGLIDFERGVKLSGSRFTVLKGKVAKLERALINFMLNAQTGKGYMEVSPPHLVKTETMRGTGQLPKFAEELYHCEADDMWLIPTAEVPVTNLFANEVLEEKQLPMKFTAYTPCYRREAGAYGKDIKGLIRQHQFDKVELVKFAHPSNSFDELEGLTADAEAILKTLELPYRTIALCTGDMGFAAAKTYDIEVWIPSQDKYREISSCSNCTDFQARRANIRFRNAEGKMEFVHTLNGSGLAVGRTLIAVLENYQDPKGVAIPKVLQDYCGFDRIDF
jgi:seryl-tRNA synthetase